MSRWLSLRSLISSGDFHFCLVLSKMYCRPDISKDSLSQFSHKCPHGTEGELCDKDLCKCHKINPTFYEGIKRERAQAASAQVTVYSHDEYVLWKTRSLSESCRQFGFQSQRKCSHNVFHLQILLRLGSNQKWFSPGNAFHHAMKWIW